MTSEELNQNVIKRICDHMNNDHSEALIAYARHYGGLDKAKSAKVLELTKDIIILEVDGNNVEISFDHTLSDSEDAHKTLVKMFKAIPKS